MPIGLVVPFSHLIFCDSHLLPSIFPSIRVFSTESAIHIRWPKYWCFSFSISPSKEYLGLISFKVEWFDLLAFQETLKSLLQHHSSKTSVLQHSAFFIICQAQTCIHDYWKEHSLDCTDLCRQSDVFIFNTLSRLVIAFLPRSNRLLISWLQSPSTVILEPKKRKSVTASTFSPSICHVSDGTRCHDLSFLILCFKLAFSL